ncbi:MAG: hypothetical protein FJ242_00075 [Nitrospira sp.]|nr:hypothetical protein [Nitrospira sp.]
MKKKNSIALLVLSSLIFITLSSCSKDLSRSAAEKKLKTLEPQLITRQIKSQYGPGIRLFESQIKDPNTFRQYEDLLDKLQAGGWIKYKRKTDSVQFFSQMLYGLWYDVHFTDKLKQFIVKRNQSGVEVLVAKREFDKVTGIAKHDPNTCEVEFMSKVTPTKLTSVFPLEKHEAEPQKHTRVFKLFDDGWRMQ